MGVLGPLWPHMPASFMELNSFPIIATDLQIIYPHQFPYPHIPPQPASNTCLQQPYSWHKNKGISALQAEYAPFFHKFCRYLVFLIVYILFFSIHPIFINTAIILDDSPTVVILCMENISQHIKTYRKALRNLKKYNLLAIICSHRV